MNLKKMFQSPLFLPLFMMVIASINIRIHLHSPIGDVWWFTVLPLAVGFVWSLISVFRFHFGKSNKNV